jgi:NAD+ diphosphatase
LGDVKSNRSKNVPPIPFSGGTLDRADARRREPGWLAARLADDATRVLPVWRGQVLVRQRSGPRLAWATPALRDSLPVGAEPVFLGLDGEVACFAADLSHLEAPLAEHGWEGVASFPDLRAVAAALPAPEAAAAAQARHLLDWHARHRFCACCGAASAPREGGWVRGCTDAGCGALHFPRTDPVAIMLVVDGERCLLGRQASWPAPFHSALAGFVEPGESLEEAVRREVAEEAGVTVGEVRYLASQPWPFPASLMLGCTARALSTAIRVDAHELESAAWFSRAEVAAALEAPTPRLALPPPLAIAHHLLRHFARAG